MAQLIRKATLLLFTQECVREYFDEFNFFHGTFTDFIMSYSLIHEDNISFMTRKQKIAARYSKY